ncbi:MAG: YceD family protein, partial [Alphaproteobacteria bacterium]
MTSSNVSHPNLDQGPVAELFRPLLVDTLRKGQHTFSIEATESERIALAGRLGILVLERLVATLTLRPVARGALIRLWGEFSADVIQECVVTLEPVSSHITESFERTFGDAEAVMAEATDSKGIKKGQGGEVLFHLDDPDPPEPIRDNRIDVGETVAEALALAIDPFPRKPGVVFEGRATCRAQETSDDGVGEVPFRLHGVMNSRGT